MFVSTVIATAIAQAQTFQVIHNFTGGQDGANPFAGVTLDKAGNLYGTTYNGGDGYGTVYKLSHKGYGWTFNPLYTFAREGSHGANPEARVLFGPNGTLYGTTGFGGIGYGTIFNLSPFPTVCKTSLCPWTEAGLYAFPGHPGGNGPSFGDLLFDQAGNIYGTTGNGGASDLGAVFEVSPSGSGWTENVLYSFCSQPNCADGVFPWSGVIENAGNLYGTTYEGGSSGYGTVFELSPSGSGWTEKVLYSFQGGEDGSFPVAGVIFDSGNLYGATSDGYYGCCGTVFKLTPSNGSWTYSLVYSFTGGGACGNYGPGPYYALVMEGGSFYGTTDCNGANNAGTVFKLTSSGDSWTYTSLHDFTGGSDGRNPFSNVVFDANGNLYGTTYSGGTQNAGVVWEITP